MKKTFICNESMIITIPIGSLKDAGDGKLMPEKFHCVFRDFYKVFAIRGKPKPLGAAQAIGGVFLCTLGLLVMNPVLMSCTLPSVLFVVTGMLTYAAGKCPNMHVAKLSFTFNIISFFWSIGAFSISLIIVNMTHSKDESIKVREICALIITLLVVENVVTLFLIYWMSKAICREHFNTLPTILLKQVD
ncbi:hypothetical protein EXN66_Car007528 [Channa argus]|uniref:Uncharacterized protein n=1 Tax=Channa argus TaxID=215402 RepID=A0A6G1PNU9_CHAAH|nr:hypothetical protein EXN66_Car007528 [Channa argus]KAK2910313.1 hypothetical protein Q8A73_008028 [Channa argus]